MKDATSAAGLDCYEFCVSIHASVKDATPLRSTSLPTSSFNPRVREGRDIPVLYVQGKGHVSIHASVKDATGRHVFHDWLVSVSIHASVKDATGG